MNNLARKVFLLVTLLSIVSVELVSAGAWGDAVYEITPADDTT